MNSYRKLEQEHDRIYRNLTDLKRTEQNLFLKMQKYELEIRTLEKEWNVDVSRSEAFPIVDVLASRIPIAKIVNKAVNYDVKSRGQNAVTYKHIQNLKIELDELKKLRNETLQQIQDADKILKMIGVEMNVLKREQR